MNYTKKQIKMSTILGVLSIMLVLFTTNIPYRALCNGDLFYFFNHYYDLFFNCSDISKFIKVTFLIFPIILLINIITFSLKENFISWYEYTKKFIVVYFIILLIVPWYVGDGFFNIQKIDYVYIFIAIYIVVLEKCFLKKKDN
jgi:hypothetical protein